MVTPDRSAEKSAGVDNACHATPVEVELKLVVPSGRLGEFREYAHLRLPVRNKGVVRRLDATYYDTANHDLYRSGLSLRVRRSGKQFTQTMKRLSPADPLSRHEWEVPVTAMVPDLGLLPVAEIGSPLEAVIAETFLPVFSTKVRRHILVVDVPDAQIEMAFDDGMIEAGPDQEPISEIELELKRGRPAALYDLGLSLMDAGPLTLGMQSKSTRGYALLSGETPKAMKAVASKLQRGDIVDDAIAGLMSDCQQQILANLLPACSGQPNGIHQLRVALRRLRTLLWILRREIAAPSLKALEGDAKHLAKSLGPARNWDVFIESTLSNIENAEFQDVAFNGLRNVCTPLRVNSYSVVRETIADPKINRFLLKLGLVIEQRSWRSDTGSATLTILAEPASKFSARVLTGIGRKARRLGRNFTQLHPEERHELRLTLKKLRYALEFFLPLYSGQASTSKYLKRLSCLQDALGEDNDIATSRGLLCELEDATGDPDLHRAIGVVIGWQRCHQLAQADRLKKEWNRFDRLELF